MLKHQHTRLLTSFRYKLLLTDLIKHTSPDHPDFRDLNSSADVIEGVAGHMNRSLHQLEETKKIYAIESRFTVCPEFVAPGRKFIYEGELMKKCRRADKPFLFFLFSDLLAYAHVDTFGKLVLHRKIPIDLKFGKSELPAVGVMMCACCKRVVCTN